MRVNPVYKRETTVASRTIRIALTMLAFNFILAIVALLNMYSVVEQVKYSAEIQYSSFLDLYIFVASIEFFLLMMIMPAITAGSISGERERQTLDLMLTTNMTPRQIIFGKLFASFNTIFILIISSFPILALVFVYGGVGLYDLLYLLAFFYVAATLVGSLGVFLSALFKQTTISTVVSYLTMLLIIVGTLAVNGFVYKIVNANQEALAMNTTFTSGGFIYFLLLNPAVTFYGLINSQAGNQIALMELFKYFGERETSFIYSNWIVISIILQILLAAFFLWMASWVINPMLHMKAKKNKK